MPGGAQRIIPITGGSLDGPDVAGTISNTAPAGAFVQLRIALLRPYSVIRAHAASADGVGHHHDRDACLLRGTQQFGGTRAQHLPGAGAVEQDGEQVCVPGDDFALTTCEVQQYMPCSSFSYVLL